MTAARGGHRVWLVAGIALFGTLALAAGIVIGTHVPRRAPDDSLAAAFARLQASLHATVGIAIGPVGSGQEPLVLGDFRSGAAWSTIKVPLVIAALRAENPPVVTPAMTAAITESDNAAAESLWTGLGDPTGAAQAVDAVLRQAGDPTSVESRRIRPEFSAFGQTEWALADQVRFVSAAWCDRANAPVFALMGQVDAAQRWGIGVVDGARFKGGWGPSVTGGYLVRQVGVLVTPAGATAIALAAHPDSGRFEDGTADLSTIADWLMSRRAALPTGSCASP
ncbi:hypothetical protein H7J51_21740 [Mycobacterium crocinum]|uniref:Class A beta-lactamase-related serine hydrolase n=1 Tax=Mycolicibacterium crocinum TaxID=388459 RepID=A0ABY3TL87_9MYCO|nr:class A beta-lactamase-related serine hydrolase [Mycolicibacterium crocinum]MCV7217898.1 hypothetical protein [Mycolicibacterium crocinum]ULN39719.1 class A beta-lactamase-related serine hydrolase [Mycolicibacterium crocinum]